MNISKILTVAQNALVPLTGVTKITPAADMTFSLQRKCAGSGAAWVAPGDAFQVNGLPIASAASETDLYAATQCKATPGTAGHIYGTEATNKPEGIKLINPGKGYAVNNTFHLICNGWTGTTSPHDAVVTVVAVDPDGGIVDFTIDEVDTTHTYTLGLATGAPELTAPSATTTHTPAVFEITALGSDANPAVYKTTAAVVTAIDMQISTCVDHGYYDVLVSRGSLSVAEVINPWETLDLAGDVGAITDGHISTVTGTYTAGQVLKIVQSANKTAEYTVLTVDASSDIATGYVSNRGSGYTVADGLHLETGAGVDQAARFDIVSIDDYTVSSDTVSFNSPTISATLASVTGVKAAPRAGDWLKAVQYVDGQLAFTFTATQVGATPTVDPRSTSTGAKIVQVANPVAGALKTVTVTAGGDAYEVGDILSVVQEGASGGKVIVLTLSTAAVATVAVIQGGQGYTAEAGLATVNEMAGSNDACTIEVVAAAEAGEYVTRLVTTTYALSGTGSLICTFVDGAKPPAAELVRMCHTFALGNKITPEIGLDANNATAEVFKVVVDGTLKTLTTDYTVEAGPFIKFAVDKSPTADAEVHVYVQTAAMICVAGDEIVFDQGASGGYTYHNIVPTAAHTLAVSYV